MPHRQGHLLNDLNFFPLNTKPRHLVLSYLHIPGAVPPLHSRRYRTCTDSQPPRKGCDPLFLTQLLQFQPLTIVYVSCNVHTQARDVGWFIDHSSQTKEEKRGEYILESLRGFDLFPQVCPSFPFSFSHFLFSFSSYCRMRHTLLLTYLKTRLTIRRLMLRVLPFFGGFLLTSYSAS